MFQRILKEKFQINGEKFFKAGRYDACIDKGKLCLLVRVDGADPEYLQEVEQLAVHYHRNGDKKVCRFLKTERGETLIKWEGRHYCVLFKEWPGEERKIRNLGRKLAKFHYRGRFVSFPLKKVNRIGQWKAFWEKRLEQMEKVWNEKLFHEPEHEFERLFLESFPYYMGLAENGIQYLTDTEIDDEPLLSDSGTVCHHRFGEFSWGGSYHYKNPFDWVFDHCARDLAEWTRERYFHNIKTYEQELHRFFADYQSFSPLSSFSWRMLYARLLFPLHYFDCVENYYSTTSEEEKHRSGDRLQRYLQYTGEHEQFLGRFFELLQVPTGKYRIPVPEWLRRV